MNMNMILVDGVVNRVNILCYYLFPASSLLPLPLAALLRHALQLPGSRAEVGPWFLRTGKWLLRVHRIMVDYSRMISP